MSFPWEYNVDHFDERRKAARAVPGPHRARALARVDELEAKAIKRKRNNRRSGKKNYLKHGRPKWYAEYLKSAHWKSFKEAYKMSGRPRQCEICGNPRYELHHRTYDRIGAEHLDDVVALCRTHHSQAHKREKNGTPLWTAHIPPE